MAKKKKCCKGKDPARLNKVGGQAVLEGVMMKAGDKTVTTCRKEDGSLVVTDGSFTSVRKKHKISLLPKKGEVMLGRSIMGYCAIPSHICKDCKTVLMDYTDTEVEEF